MTRRIKRKRKSERERERKREREREGERKRERKCCLGQRTEEASFFSLIPSFSLCRCLFFCTRKRTMMKSKRKKKENYAGDAECKFMQPEFSSRETMMICFAGLVKNHS